MTDITQIFFLSAIFIGALHLGYYFGRQDPKKTAPHNLIEVSPLPYVAFQPGSRVADRIAFLEGILKALKSKESAEVTRLENEA
jgi:hypothetical protein